jgi:DNA-binding transcriptional regulator GbsR (MarR family)
VRHVSDVRDEFVQLWGRLGPLWGIAPVTAAVYAWLLARLAPADADEIQGALHISRGAVSMACRELADWGLIHTDRPLGSRRLLYRPEEDLAKTIRSIIATRKRREWDPILEHVRAWKALLERDGSADAAHLRTRLETIEGVVTLVESLAERFLRGGVVQRVGLNAVVAGARGARRRKQKEGS